MADFQKIEEKMDKGEELTKEEKDELMSAPNVQIDGDATPAADAELEKDGSTEPGKKAEDAGDKGTPDKKDPADGADTEKLLRDLELPEEEADLSSYTPRERGLFNQLRKERTKAQDAQRVADQLNFEKKQSILKRQQEEAKKEAAEADAILDGLDDDDFLTAGQAKKIIGLVKGKSKPTEEAQDDAPASATELENYALKAFMADSEQESFALASQNMELLLMNDAEAQSVLAKARREGKNPVQLAIQMVRNHPKWAQIKAKAGLTKAAPATQKDENRERLKKIEENENKPKQLGAGGGDSEGDTDEYSLQELANMDPSEFALLPKSKRKELLLKLGG